ncbi:hypothetical protein OF83DRAFT_451750 [Amylostereum chailletii]|nr:hypothetical protein OF83DRAFT_451750 [Amylostereum chailletii]
MLATLSFRSLFCFAHCCRLRISLVALPPTRFICPAPSDPIAPVIVSSPIEEALLRSFLSTIPCSSSTTHADLTSKRPPSSQDTIYLHLLYTGYGTSDHPPIRRLFLSSWVLPALLHPPMRTLTRLAPSICQYPSFPVLGTRLLFVVALYFSSLIHTRTFIAFHTTFLYLYYTHAAAPALRAALARSPHTKSTWLYY